jgi:hypothetical protein
MGREASLQHRRGDSHGRRGVTGQGIVEQDSSSSAPVGRPRGEASPATSWREPAALIHDPRSDVRKPPPQPTGGTSTAGRASDSSGARRRRGGEPHFQADAPHPVGRSAEDRHRQSGPKAGLSRRRDPTPTTRSTITSCRCPCRRRSANGKKELTKCGPRLQFPPTVPPRFGGPTFWSFSTCA